MFNLQVVLVDDASDMAHLGEPLQSYISRWRGKVEVVRSGESVYLARAGQVIQSWFVFKAREWDWRGLVCLEWRKQLLRSFSSLTHTVRWTSNFKTS